MDLKPDDLRSWRKSHGLSCLKLAQILGVARHTLVRWEQGHSRIPGTVGWALESVERHLVEQREVLAG
jgi:DNA-binding transcriptional regulator YiaG